MIQFNWRELTPEQPGEQTCEIKYPENPYKIITGKISETELNDYANQGYELVAFEKIGREGEIDKTILVKLPIEICSYGEGDNGEQFDIVGQAHSGHTSTTTEFLIKKQWTYGEIANSGLLIFLSITVFFTGLYFIIKRKSYSKKR